VIETRLFSPARSYRSVPMSSLSKRLIRFQLYSARADLRAVTETERKAAAKPGMAGMAKASEPPGPDLNDVRMIGSVRYDDFRRNASAQPYSSTSVGSGLQRRVSRANGRLDRLQISFPDAYSAIDISSCYPKIQICSCNYDHQWQCGVGAEWMNGRE
jgi:hypothetical protein